MSFAQKRCLRSNDFQIFALGKKERKHVPFLFLVFLTKMFHSVNMEYGEMGDLGEKNVSHIFGIIGRVERTFSQCSRTWSLGR